MQVLTSPEVSYVTQSHTELLVNFPAKTSLLSGELKHALGSPSCSLHLPLLRSAAEKTAAF